MQQCSLSVQKALCKRQNTQAQNIPKDDYKQVSNIYFFKTS